MPGRCFPDRFAPSDWRGPRATSARDRSDSFQQLVADALKETFGASATTTRTAGNDGSIDAWVEAGAADVAGRLGVPFPAVVECKDHDDSLGTLLKNVRTGWDSVAGKLARQAEAGWPGAFAPWRRARAYVHCVSCVLPSRNARDTLKSTIIEFLGALPDASRPPIEQVRVLDWSDLRPWLDGLPRVGDLWLGVGLDLIVSLASYQAGLVGFERYLTDAAMPFEPPPPGASFLPATVFQRLQGRLGAGGVLLAGPGGIGKSRSAFEVARLADSAGWRVLYLRPGEPGIDSDMLAEAVFVGRGPTLLVTDYLDQARRLDLGILRRTLLPEALARGVPTAILATTRPAWLMRPNVERDALLERIDVDPDAGQRRRVLAVIADHVAPTAQDVLGGEEFVRVCGERPTLALLIARELERLARAGRLRSDATVNVRTGDLAAWLQRRLAEDGLAVPPAASPLQPPTPPAEVVAAGAVLGCTPSALPELTEAAAAAFTSVGSNAGHADHLVRALRTLGWIELRGVDLAAAHDLVADEVLDRVLLDGPSVRRPMLDAVLSTTLENVRHLGRMATALGRVIGGMGPEGASNLTDSAEVWLGLHAERLGSRLLDADPDSAAYALGAVVAGPPWSAASLRCWDALIGVWLTRHGTHTSARHLLYQGLRALPQGHGTALGAPALDWLESHLLELQSSFVLGPLVSRTDLDATHGNAAVAAALRWLATHEEKDEAQFVFHPLLSRADLDATHGNTAVAAALRWLATHEKKVEASFVLNPLLARAFLDGTQGNAVVAAALRWLATHGEEVEARFVFHPLLSRADLDATHGNAAVTVALRWLATHGEKVEAGFVLPPLLSRADLDATHGNAAVAAALRWLATHEEKIEANFVLNPLLARAFLDGTQGNAAVAAALRWLATHGEKVEAKFVLSPLLRRHDLPASTRTEVTAAALDRLQLVLAEPEASFLLVSVLGNRELQQTQGTIALHLAADWLDQHPDDPDAEFVFNRVLRIPYAEDAIWRRAAAWAIAWLRSHAQSNGAERALYGLLTRPHLLSDANLEFSLNSAIDCSGDAEFVGRLLVRAQEVARDTVHEHRICAAVARRFAHEPGDGTDGPVDWKRLVSTLTQAARSGDRRADLEVVTHALERMRRVAVRSRRAAAFAIPPILALATRSDEATSKRVLVEARGIVAGLEDWQSAEITVAVLRLADEGAVAPPWTAKQLLDECGLVHLDVGTPLDSAAWQKLTDRLARAVLERGASVGGALVLEVTEEAGRQSMGATTHVLPHLFAAATRTDDQVRPHALSLCQHIAADEHLTAIQANRISRAVLHLGEAGCIGPPWTAIGLLRDARLPTSPPREDSYPWRQVVRALDREARRTDGTGDDALVTSATVRAEGFAARAPGLAGQALPALLAIASRTDSPHRERVAKLARTVAPHDRLHPAMARLISYRLLRLESEGHVLTPPGALALLREAGLPLPESRPPEE